MELWLLVCTFIVGFAFGHYRKGYWVENVGENAVRAVLTEQLSSDNYHLLNNVTLPTQKGTTQIDHILVSTKGIFVIETKHYKGWIFASAQAKYWTQVIYKSKKAFLNPLRQNYAHLKAVQTLLDFLDPQLVKPIVVFTGDAVFKKGKPQGVFVLEELVKAIECHSEDVMSPNRVQFCVGRLECYRYRLSKETDIEHVRNLSRK